MMWYHVLFTDGTGCEFEARDQQHAEQIAKETYPHKTIIGDAMPCEFLDLPF